MTYIASITDKGQITIPAEVRRWLQVKVGDQVAFTRINDRIVVKPATDFIAMKGSVPKSKSYSDKQADRAILSYIKKGYVRKATRS